MKKKIVTLCLISVLALGGCGSAKTATSETSSSEAQSTEATSTTAESEAAGTESTVTDSTGTGQTTSYDSAPTTTDTVSNGDYSAYISIPQYKGLQIKASDDTTAKKGMTVNIDYKGTIDGKAFDGGTAQNYDLVLGSGQFISGFEDQLVGHKKGDKVDVVVTFPKDYGVDSLNGKEAHFATTLNEIYVTTPSDAVSALIQKAKVKAYPQELLDKWTNTAKKVYGADAKSQNETVDSYLKRVGVTDDMMNDTVRNFAKGDMLYRTIVSKEGITEDSDQYKKAHSAVLSQIGVSTDSDAEKTGYTSEQVSFYTYNQLTQDIIEKYEA